MTSTRFADPLTQGIADTELVVFEDCAHAPIYENVAAFNERTLGFLHATPASRVTGWRARGRRRHGRRLAARERQSRPRSSDTRNGRSSPRAYPLLIAGSSAMT